MKKQNLKNKLKKVMSITLALNAFTTATGALNTLASYTQPKITSPSSDRQKNLNDIAFELKTAWDSYVSGKKKIEQQFEGNFSNYKKERSDLLDQKEDLEEEIEGRDYLINCFEKLNREFLMTFKEKALNALYNYYKNILSCHASNYDKDNGISEDIIHMCRAYLANFQSKDDFNNPFLNKLLFECDKIWRIPDNDPTLERYLGILDPKNSVLSKMDSHEKKIMYFLAQINILLQKHLFLKEEEKIVGCVDNKGDCKATYFLINLRIPFYEVTDEQSWLYVRCDKKTVYCKSFADLEKNIDDYYYYGLFAQCYKACQESSDILYNSYSGLKSKIPKEYKNKPIDEELTKDFCFKELANHIFGENNEWIDEYLSEQEKFLNRLRFEKANFQKELDSVNQKIEQNKKNIDRCEEFKKAPEENAFVKYYYNQLITTIENTLDSRLPNPFNGDGRTNTWCKKEFNITERSTKLDTILKEKFGETAIIIKDKAKENTPENDHLNDHFKNKNAIIADSKQLNGKFNINGSVFQSCSDIKQVLQETFNNSIIVVTKYETEENSETRYSYVCYIFDCNSGKFINTGMVYDKETKAWSPAQAIVLVTSKDGVLVTAYPRLIR